VSLNRYQNRDILVDLNDPQYAQIYTDEDLSALSVYYFNIDDENAIKKSVSELHIYSFTEQAIIRIYLIFIVRLVI
jgi:hypothetical protein